MRPILQRPTYILSLSKLTSATRPDGPPTLLVRCFFRGSFFNSQRKTAVWLSNLYVRCSIVHTLYTASEYRPTLGTNVESRTTILILISGPWDVNEKGFQMIAQWTVFWLGGLLAGRSFGWALLRKFPVSITPII